MYDATHLNPSGARKVTEYMGRFIKENYNIPDQRENEEYSFWKEDYNEYIDYKIENLKKNNTKLNNYLMLLYDEQDIKYEITLSTKVKIEEESTFEQLLKNINNNYKVSDKVFKESKDNKNKTINIKTYDNRNGELIEEVWF